MKSPRMEAGRKHVVYPDMPQPSASDLSEVGKLCMYGNPGILGYILFLIAVCLKFLLEVFHVLLPFFLVI